MAPGTRKGIHFETAAERKYLFATVRVNQDGIGQPLAYFLHDVRAGRGRFVLVPIAECRKADESRFMLKRNLEAASRPGASTRAQGDPTLLLHCFGSEQKWNAP